MLLLHQESKWHENNTLYLKYPIDGELQLKVKT